MTLSPNIYLGKYTLAGLVVAEHWAICVGDTWYEVAGTSKLDQGGANEILSHKDSCKYTGIELLGTMVNTSENVERWNKRCVAQNAP